MYSIMKSFGSATWNGYIKQGRTESKKNVAYPCLILKLQMMNLAQEMSIRFLDMLPTRTILFPYTKEILEYLTDKEYILHLITNGV